MKLSRRRFLEVVAAAPIVGPLVKLPGVSPVANPAVFFAAVGAGLSASISISPSHENNEPNEPDDDEDFDGE